MYLNDFEHSELGKTSIYDMSYAPKKLFAIPRILQRKEIGVTDSLPFFGFDLWNHYEVSWLNEKGKPIVALAEIIYSCDTPNIVESKSLKLYFNSFNNHKFKDVGTVKNIIQKDLATIVGGDISISLFCLPLENNCASITTLPGECIDQLDVECNIYTIDTSYLSTENEMVEEVLYSNLLKSNCLVTNQPDWASVQIAYKGKKINRAGLLRYIVSYRNHNEFHEQCIERMFVDISRACNPTELTIYGRYTRRGGIDINPYRSSLKEIQSNLNIRLCRQ